MIISIITNFTPQYAQALSPEYTKDLLFAKCMEIMMKLAKTEYRVEQTITQCHKDAEDFYPYIKKGENSFREAIDYWIEEALIEMVETDNLN